MVRIILFNLKSILQKGKKFCSPSITLGDFNNARVSSQSLPMDFKQIIEKRVFRLNNQLIINHVKLNCSPQ